MEPVHVEQSRAIPVPVEDAFRRTLPLPLTDLFRRWHGPIPPIKAVRDQDGEWGTVGQTRTIALTGGGSMREELTRIDPPSSFGYRLTELTGALGPLVDHVVGEWAFAPKGTGTEVTWRWTLYPKSRVTRPGVVALGKLWPGYARKALAELSDHLLPT